VPEIDLDVAQLKTRNSKGGGSSGLVETKNPGSGVTNTVEKVQKIYESL